MSTTSTESRAQRRRRLGIDCVDRVVWRQWEPFGEYVKKIRIRNLDARPQTIEHTQPLRKDIFFMDFSEPVTLSSGMSLDLEVRYRPIDAFELHDVIKVSVVGRGSFLLQLECEVPHAKLQVQPYYDFTYTAVGSTAVHTVTMKNIGGVVVDFAWEVVEPFAIDPVSGVLAEGESVNLQLFFAPLEACTVVAQLFCWRTGTREVLAHMKLSGVGKYPFIRVATTLPGNEGVGLSGENSLLVDFGHQLVTTTRVKEFELENPSMVDADFTIELPENQCARQFTITPKAGVITRGKSQRFKVVFAPAVLGAACVAFFRVVTSTGNAVSGKILGVSALPVVCASTSAIDFGDVRLGEAAVATSTNRQPVCQRFFLIKNLSEIALDFFFISTCPGAVFVVEPTSGELPAKGSVRVQVVFCPTRPINYLRRLLILVKNTDTLLYVDVFGSAYNGVIRPLPFTAKDVGEFFQRHEYGLAGAGPNDLVVISDILRGGGSYDEVIRLMLSKESFFAAGLEKRKSLYSGGSNSGEINTTRKRHKKGARLDFSHLKNLFSPKAPFYLATDVLLFAADNCEPQRVKVYNRTNVLATAYWCVPNDSPFYVTPMQDDVPPCSFCTFTVAMTGNFLLHLVDYFLECYVNFKQMRSFRLIEEGGFTPPHFFSLRCQREVTCGVGDAGTFAPHVHVPKSIAFPPSRTGDTVRLIVYLENRSFLSIMFGINAYLDVIESQNDLLQEDVLGQQPISCICYPDTGLIPPNQSVPVMLSVQLTVAARYRGKALIRLNKSPKDEIEVSLAAESFLPKLLVEDGSMIVLRPTCVTGVMSRRLKISNPTCIPLAFDASVTEELADVLHITPAHGTLGAGQQTELTLLFAPLEVQMYKGHINFISCFTDDAAQLASLNGDVNCGPGKQKNHISCPCVGEGRHAVVEVEPVTMEHEGPAMHEETFEWTIYNSGVCDVCYEVCWMSKTDPAHQQDFQEAPPLQLGRNKKGTLAARSHTVVLVTLRPQAGVSDYILYALVGGSGVNLSAIPRLATLDEVRQHPHCEVRLKGTRPAIQITDVRSFEQCRSQLWCQLGINSVNAVLAAPIQAKDLEKDSFAFMQYIRGLEPIFMDIGVGSVLHGKKEILLCVENSGLCSASFRFWYPTEHEGGNETWFLDDEELEDVQRIISDRLIDISPREGIIPVGSRKVITITYFHTVVGTHCLPVLLRIDEGKKALLVLEARTVLPDTNALAFHHPYVYNLHPVALGDLEPPLQTTTIENTASREVNYIVQKDLAQHVAEKNCGFPVFQCLNPTGTILPGSSVQLHWYFRPLEARKYCIDVLLQTVGGEEYNFQFVGVGYHPKKVTAAVACEMINNAFLSIPVSPSLSLPVERYPVALSMDVMRVGAVPTFSLHRRICYLENRHTRNTYSFSWETQLAPGSSMLTVTPQGGVLGPGRKVRCIFALHCGSLSQILETSVFCRLCKEPTQGPAEGKKSLAFESHAVAVDGKLGGADEAVMEYEIRDDPLLDAKKPPKTDFTRSTCTKLRPPGDKRRRLPLAAPAYSCYQTAPKVAGSVTAAHVSSTAAATNSQGHSFQNLSYVDLESSLTNHLLEVFVQARVMPIEAYERLYGKRVLQQMHFPSFNSVFDNSSTFSHSQGPQSECSTSYSSEQVNVARKVLDSLLRAVIAQQPVRAAFTEAIREGVPLYRDIVDTCVNPTTVDSAGLPNRLDLAMDGDDPLQTSFKMHGAAKEDGEEVSPNAPGSMKVTKTFEEETGALPRCDGAATNFIEELIADVTMHAVSGVIENIQQHNNNNSKGLQKMKG